MGARPEGMSLQCPCGASFAQTIMKKYSAKRNGRYRRDRFRKADGRGR